MMLEIIRKYKVRRWLRILNLHQHEAVFQQCFQNVDGFRLSRQARLNADAMEYTYGEINFLSFIALLSLAHPTKEKKFYDLGSGTGKAVLAAAMVFDMQFCCGVELFEPLYQAAEQCKTLLQSSYHMGAVQFIHGDFLTIDFSQADIIFINATAFWGPVWERLNMKLAELPPETTILTISKMLDAAHFSVKKVTYVQMSWGMATAYVHLRKV